MEQLLAHLVGDYIFQTHTVAKYKVRNSFVAVTHAVLYLIPFILFGPSILALAVMGGTHFLIDRFSLARYIMIVNGNPPNDVYTYEDGYTYPIYTGNLFLVYVVVDNALHLLINYFSLRYL